MDLAALNHHDQSSLNSLLPLLTTSLISLKLSFSIVINSLKAGKKLFILIHSIKSFLEDSKSITLKPSLVKSSFGTIFPLIILALWNNAS